MSLPYGDYNFYVGIDPGKYGALCLMNADGTMVRLHDMPMLDMKAKGKERQYDLPNLWKLLRDFARLSKVTCGLENPQTRPGEGAERARWFGEGIGYLRMGLVATRLDYHLLAPNLWKGRLGLPGKDTPGAERVACETFATYYPEHADEVRFPSKHSGRADAGLIAHFLRTRSLTGHKSIADKFGKGSVEVMAHLWRGKNRKHGMKLPGGRQPT